MEYRRRMRKIGFLGLDNAGKTSIIIGLQKKYDFHEQIAGLKPTIKVERSSFKFLNMEVARHDFGGQEKYREEYLEHKERFLSNTDLMYYVIDIQDPNRFEISLKYFNEIVTFYKEENIVLPIVVLLHKFDPKLRQDKKILQSIMSLKKSLNEWLPHHNIYFFETSVFDLYSLVEAFSFGMCQLFERKELIDNYMTDVGKEFNTISFLLFDDNGLALNEFYKDHLTDEEREKIKDLFLNAQRRISESSNNTYEFSDWISQNTRISGVIQSFSVGYLKFYLLFIIDETTEEETVKMLDLFDKYKKDLSEILKGLISNSSVTI